MNIDKNLTALERTLLYKAVELSTESKNTGNHPFAALLADEEGSVILTAFNSFSTTGGPGHAETNLARKAASKYPPEFLENCTLVTPIESCCMCSGALYWAGIGRVLYGVSEKRLAELTGDNPENLTMDLSCREVFAKGQRDVVVRGPFEDEELVTAIVKDHLNYWQ